MAFDGCSNATCVDGQQQWDLDSILAINQTWYRERYPYPYFHYLPAQQHIVNRATYGAPMHLLCEWAAATFFFWAFRCLAERFVFQPIAGFLRIRSVDRGVFYESCLQGLYYTASWCVLAWFLLEEDFLWNPLYIFEGNYPNQPMSPIYYWLYVVHLGWYAFNLYAHVFLDERKKDYWNLLAHHLVTLVLIYLSLVQGYYRWGLLTLFCHDVCDIFLHAAKLLKYVENSRSLPEWLPFVFFPPIPISWLIFRLGIFPKAVVWQAVTCPQLGVHDCPDHTIFGGLLVILLALQVYWFCLIIKVAIRKLKGKSWEDVRESKDKRGRKEKEEEEEEEEPSRETAEGQVNPTWKDQGIHKEKA